jgi:MFS family permease
MNERSQALGTPQAEAHVDSSGAFIRFIVIALIAFLTVVDLFATQAILPSLTKHYGVTPAAMGFAVNACTLGMAVAGLAVGYFSREIDRRKGILVSLVLLAIPTALLAHAPDLTTFTILRVAQGLCMAAAFTLTLAYLGEHYSAANSASAFAAYITGNSPESHRAADLGGGGRPFRARHCRPQPARCGTRLLHRGADAGHDLHRP